MACPRKNGHGLYAAGAAIGREMSHIQPQLLEKQKVRHVGGIIVAGSGVAVLARLLGDGFDHAFIVVPRGVPGREQHGIVLYHAAHGRQRVRRIGHFLDIGIHSHGSGGTIEDGVAVGLGEGRLGIAGHAGSAGDVLDDHILAEFLAQNLGEGPGGNIRASARRVAHDHDHGFLRIGRIPRCRKNQQGKREQEGQPA